MSVEERGRRRGRSRGVFPLSGRIRRSLEVSPKGVGWAPREPPGLGHLLLTWGTKISQLASNSVPENLNLPHALVPALGEPRKDGQVGCTSAPATEDACLSFRCFQPSVAQSPAGARLPKWCSLVGGGGGGGGVKHYHRQVEGHSYFFLMSDATLNLTFHFILIFSLFSLLWTYVKFLCSK